MSHKKYVISDLHGHTHYNKIDDTRYTNVCCEVVDYKPILIQNIIK